MKIAMLSPIASRTAPRDNNLWERSVSLLAEGLVRRGIDVTLFAPQDLETRGRPTDVGPKGDKEGKALSSKVRECLHVSEVFEQGNEFDLIHNHFDYLPLTYSAMTTTPVLTTIHGFSSPRILAVYRKYSGRVYYVAISQTDKNPQLDYIATIHHGIDLAQLTFNPRPGDYLLFFGGIHPGKGSRECIEVAKETGMRLILAGNIEDAAYFEREVKPWIDGKRIIYAKSAGPEKRNELLGGAYALLHPVNRDEPFCLSVVEAMACGTPVIAINHGSMPEVIADGATGFVVADTRQMAPAVSKIKDIDRRRCRRWVEERFTADRMVEDYLRVYEEVLRQTRREDRRPWGFYEILSDRADHKLKRITVHPGQRLSYQRHFRRSEHWYIVSGQAVVTRNGREVELASGQAIDLPVGTWHRIRNPGNETLIFIEVQTGEYFGENDIERSEDDYGRA
jgi:mannose-6-phosphate isomerase-like protein (cupin superfamily)